MRSATVTSMVFAALAALVEGSAFGHVPYFEHRDFSGQRPFQVASITQSIAVYSWLEPSGGDPGDVDVYRFEISQPTRIFVEALVPMCPEYEGFLPAFAVVGPGLPQPGVELPFELPPGYGAVLVENFKPGQERPTFYEPFGGKSYYDGPDFDQLCEEPGTYYVYFWDPKGNVGDYVAVLGYQEIWRFRDIVRGLVFTPLIRLNLELHTVCEAGVSE